MGRYSVHTDCCSVPVRFLAVSIFLDVVSVGGIVGVGVGAVRATVHTRQIFLIYLVNHLQVLRDQFRSRTSCVLVKFSFDFKFLGLNVF